ncbi:M20 family metallopeptidase [Serpentinicella sp. ANB-PHB4]|uniref:M20 metallopeptidase family protein n=1 Tax=Serpentinicella sp. ANB-PHB4 TaxID=3074076 RepID=UPI002857C732|nr:M20 family metallopeptidase [Serpentinicella sp. ANB-PHB4]MDR5659563.1 M20 family metallopeptidase [Serpentinicella sp. ANB-PHB4]
MFSTKIEHLGELIKNVRQDLHKIPEIAFEEFKTALYIEQFLKDLGVSFEKGIVGTGILVSFKGVSPTKTICFRADMDALDVEEQNDVSYKSQHNKRMHACGHDGHMAILLGLAKFLKDHEDRIKDNIILLFQPAEEGPGGAAPIIDNGILKKYGVSEIYGLHLFPNISEGKFGVKKGPMMSQTGEFDILIKGKSGHGAMPHTALDSIVIASEMVIGLQSIISRTVNPIEPAVLTIGRIDGGEIRNVIAKQVKLEGTIRTFSQEVYDLIKGKINDFKKGYETSYGCTIEVIFRDMYPAVINDETLTQCFIDAQNEGTVEIIDPIMLAEDFSYYQKEIPGVFFFLGTKNESKGYTYPLHNGAFNFDEKVLQVGLDGFVKILIQRGALV